MSHSGCSLFAICPSTTHSLSDRKRQQEVGQCASLRNSFSITYLYLIHIKKVYSERTQEVLQMSTNFGSGKRNKNSIQLESEFQIYSSRSPDYKVKWTKFYMWIQRTPSESPSTCNKGPSSMFPVSLSEARVSG